MAVFNTRTKNSDDSWRTPVGVLGAIEFMAGEPIRYDAFCTPDNAVAEPIDLVDALSVDWPTDGLVFANPPYGDALIGVAAHVARQADRGVRLVMLVPSSTGAVWWHVLLQNKHLRCSFLLGRVQFLDPTGAARQANNHNSCLFHSTDLAFPASIRTSTMKRFRRRSHTD